MTTESAEKRNILVSIILTESAASVLKLSLPHLEDSALSSTHSSLCRITTETNFMRDSTASLLSRYSLDYDDENISTEPAYFTKREDTPDSDDDEDYGTKRSCLQHTETRCF